MFDDTIYNNRFEKIGPMKINLLRILNDNSQSLILDGFGAQPLFINKRID